MSERNAAILIVDDNPANVSLLTAMLDEAGYDNVHGITDSRQVIPRVTEAEYDLILLDIRMPHLDGIAILNLLAGLGRDDFLPVLVLTAQTDQDTRKAALAAGAKDFISCTGRCCSASTTCWKPGRSTKASASGRICWKRRCEFEPLKSAKPN
jgi:CheY-like chemotaxis protein